MVNDDIYDVLCDIRDALGNIHDELKAIKGYRKNTSIHEIWEKLDDIKDTLKGY